MKYVRQTSIDEQGIYDDIFRLSLIDDANAVKYFLLCGEIGDFDSKIFNDERKPFTKNGGKIELRERASSTQKRFCDILSFSSENTTKTNTFYADENIHFKSFVNNEKYYPGAQKANAPTQIGITTDLVQPYSKGLKSAVAIWEIR